jgi:hypothetical protein
MHTIWHFFGWWGDYVKKRKRKEGKGNRREERKRKEKGIETMQLIISEFRKGFRDISIRR